MNRKQLNRPQSKSKFRYAILIQAACLVAGQACAQSAATALFSLQEQQPSSSITLEMPTSQISPQPILKLNRHGELAISRSSLTICIGYGAERTTTHPHPDKTVKTLSPNSLKGAYIRLALAF